MVSDRMAYVYILSDYEEHGAENVCATLDRGRLHQLVDKNWPPPHNSTASKEWTAEAHAGLEEHLKKSDDVLSSKTSGWNCHSGWGGMQLHVVELKE
jgi:hypothetical protein